MSMTELERHLLNCLEGLQQEFRSSQENQNKRLEILEIRQKKMEADSNYLKIWSTNLSLLLQRLNNILQRK